MPRKASRLLRRLVEMRRLKPVELLWLDEIVWTDRDIERLFGVQVDVAEREEDRVVGIGNPGFKDGNHRLAVRQDIGDAERPVLRQSLSPALSALSDEPDAAQDQKPSNRTTRQQRLSWHAQSFIKLPSESSDLSGTRIAKRLIAS